MDIHLIMIAIMITGDEEFGQRVEDVACEQDQDLHDALCRARPLQPPLRPI